VADEKFLEPLMPFAHGDVRDHIVSFRIDQQTSVVALQSDGSNREAKRSAFARFLGLFDFRLLQQYRHETDLPGRPDDVCS